MKKLIEKYKNLKDNKKVLAVFGILSAVLITVAASYAFFSYSKLGLTDNTLQTGSIKFIYNESNRVGNGISLTDAMPMTDEVGKAQDKYFDFSVTGTSGTSKLNYEITARKVTGSDNLDEYVKMYLTKVNGNNETQKVLSIYDDLSDSTNAIAVLNNEKTLYRDSIPVGATDYTENYRLRMWLNNDTNDGSVLEYTQTETGVCSDTTYTNETDCVAAHKDWTRTAVPMSSKVFTVKINVYANGEMATQQEIADANSTGINGVIVNDANIALNEDLTKNYDFYKEVENEISEIEIDINEKVEGQTFTVESITENEANTIRQISTVVKLPVIEGNNYFKISVNSANGKKNDEYVLKVFRKEKRHGSFLPKSELDENLVLDGLAKMVYESNTVITTAPNLKTVDKNNNTNKIYKSTSTNSDLPTYYFRGEVNNNYVSFANKTWRIIRINEDGTVRIILNSSAASSRYNDIYSNNYKDMYISYVNASYLAHNKKTILDN